MVIYKVHQSIQEQRRSSSFFSTIIFYGCSSNGTSGTQSNNAFTKKICKSAHYENMQSYA
jgi:hypothetical protein